MDWFGVQRLQEEQRRTGGKETENSDHGGRPLDQTINNSMYGLISCAHLSVDYIYC